MEHTVPRSKNSSTTSSARAAAENLLNEGSRIWGQAPLLPVAVVLIVGHVTSQKKGGKAEKNTTPTTPSYGSTHQPNMYTRAQKYTRKFLGFYDQTKGPSMAGHEMSLPAETLQQPSWLHATSLTIQMFQISMSTVVISKDSIGSKFDC